MTDSRTTFDQLTDTARLALGRGDRGGAQASLSAAYRTAQEGGLVHHESADALIRLGTLFQDAGLHDEAERLFAEALAAGERAMGDADVGLVPALTSLGNAMIARGANDEAEPVLTRALAISEAALGLDHQDLNVLLNALSRLYLKQGALARAEPLLERLLVLKRNKGDDHPEVATVLASLVIVRQGAGDHDGAEQLARNVLRIRERTLAPNHFAVASALELLADVCSARGKLAEALRLYQRALSIREQTLGVSHASLRVARERIADLQLQAADEPLGEPDTDGVASIPALMSLPLTRRPLPAVQAPASRPPVQPLVSRPPDVALSLPRPLSVPARAESESTVLVPAPRADIDRPVVLAPPRAAAVGAPARDFEGDESRQESLVLPASDGALSLQDELKRIEGELMEEELASSTSRRLSAMAMGAWSAVSAKPVQAAVVTASALAMLLVALIAQPHAAEYTQAQGLARTTGASRLTQNDNAPLSSASVDSSPLSSTATGSVDARSLSSTTATRLTSARNVDRDASRPTPNSEGDDAQSLELVRSIKAPLANVNVQSADSLARVSDLATKPAANVFSKQFWTAGSDRGQGADSPTPPTRAKIQGALPQPAYPEFLRKNGVEGEVVVQLVVDESGRPDVSSLEVVRSPHEALTDAVRKVVGQIHFDPALTAGPQPKPRAEVVRISYVFKSNSK